MNSDRKDHVKDQVLNEKPNNLYEDLVEVNATQSHLSSQGTLTIPEDAEVITYKNPKSKLVSEALTYSFVHEKLFGTPPEAEDIVQIGTDSFLTSSLLAILAFPSGKGQVIIESMFKDEGDHVIIS